MLNKILIQWFSFHVTTRSHKLSVYVLFFNFALGYFCHKPTMICFKDFKRTGYVEGPVKNGTNWKIKEKKEEKRKKAKEIGEN